MFSRHPEVFLPLAEMQDQHPIGYRTNGPGARRHQNRPQLGVAMEPLRSPRHAKFVQALFEGKPANRAYVEAGYAPHDGNCIRLRGNERIKARLAELQAAAAKSARITI